MPHNLYLHSALVQSRKLQKDEPSIRSAIRFNNIDSIVALTIAFFINAAILVLAAIANATLHPIAVCCVEWDKDLFSRDEMAFFGDEIYFFIEMKS